MLLVNTLEGGLAMAKKREQWGSRIGFIVAAAGSAIGLGNIWRFPTVTGQNGGGAFVLLYLVLVFLVGIPVLMVELSLGRKAQRNPVGAFKTLAPGTLWKWVGAMGVAAGFIILSFYSVIAGWSVAYIFKFLLGAFTGLSPAGIAQEFNALVTHPVIPLLWHGLFMLLTAGIVVLGVAWGIERWNKILMPMLLVLLIVLVVRSVTLDGARKGVYWLLRPDFSQLSFASVLTALGQVFFSLSLGMGAMITYGSYLGARENIPGSAVYIALADLAVALLAGLVIIPAVFAFGLNPETGPPLIFLTLPAVFQRMPLGGLFGAMFFFLLRHCRPDLGHLAAGSGGGLLRRRAQLEPGRCGAGAGFCNLFAGHTLLFVRRPPGWFQAVGDAHPRLQRLVYRRHNAAFGGPADGYFCRLGVGAPQSPGGGGRRPSLCPGRLLVLPGALAVASGPCRHTVQRAEPVIKNRSRDLFFILCE